MAQSCLLFSQSDLGTAPPPNRIYFAEWVAHHVTISHNGAMGTDKTTK